MSNDEARSANAAAPPSLGSMEFEESPFSSADYRESLASVDGSLLAHDIIGSVVADRYRILRLLGEGGMGAVYLAEHVHMKKPFAVKVLHRELTSISEVVARFEREAVAAGLIDHPNVAKATDFGQLRDGSFFLVLEYVEGESLSRALQLQSPFPQERALIIGRQIVDALGAAHAAGIVHRDLKPDNVMLIDRGSGYDFVKVLDFGIAKLDTGSGAAALTQLGTVFGTPQYMAPEQAAGQTVDCRADLYTVGMILYEMLSGAVPFDGEEIGAVLAKQITVVPPPLGPHVDEALRLLVARQLEKSAGARVQTSEELLLQIDAILERFSAEPGSVLRANLPPASALSLSMPPPSVATAQPGAQTVLSHPEGAQLTWQARVRGMPGVRVPFVILGGAGFALMVLGAVLASFAFLVVGVASSHEPAVTLGAASGAATASVAPADPDLKGVLASASTGDAEAIAQLEKLPTAKRTSHVWLALGQGYTAQGRTAPGLEAYDQALKQDVRLAKDRAVVSHIRAGANRAETGNLAISIAERHLGSVGADMLYDIYVATRAKNEQTTLAKSLLDSPEVKARFSPALRVAMALRDAKTCGDYKKLLPDVTLHGDTRSQRILQKLTSRKGCGFLKMGDCYHCLRGDSNLSEALSSAQKRPEPQF